MSVAIDLNRRRIFSNLSALETYKILRGLWIHYPRLRCYYFPMRMMRDKETYNLQGDWDLEIE